MQLSLRRLPRLRSPKRMVMGRPQPRPHRAWPLTTGGSLCHAVLGLLFVRVHFGPPSLEPRTRPRSENACSAIRNITCGLRRRHFASLRPPAIPRGLAKLQGPRLCQADAPPPAAEMKRTQEKSGSKFSSPHGREDIDEPQDPNKPNTAKKGPRPLTRDDPDVAFGFAGDGDGVTPQPFLARPPAAPSAEAQPTASSPFARAAPASAPETAASTLAPPAPAEPRAEPEQKTEADKAKATYDEAVEKLNVVGFFPAARMAPPKTLSAKLLKFGIGRPDGNVDDGEDGSYESGSDVMSGVDPDEDVSELLGDWRAFNGELETERDELDVAVDRATDALAKVEDDLLEYNGPKKFSKRSGTEEPEDRQIYDAFREEVLAQEQRALDEAEESLEAFPAVVKQRRTQWALDHDLGLSLEVALDLREFHGPWYAAFQAECDAAGRLEKHREVITRVVLGGKDWVGPCTFRWRSEPPDATYFDEEDSETVRTLQLGVYAFGCPRCEQWWLRPMAPVIASFDNGGTVQIACRTCVAQEGDAHNPHGRLLLDVNRRDFGFAVRETLRREGHETTMRALVRFA